MLERLDQDHQKIISPEIKYIKVAQISEEEFLVQKVVSNDLPDKKPGQQIQESLYREKASLNPQDFNLHTKADSPQTIMNEILSNSSLPFEVKKLNQSLSKLMGMFNVILPGMHVNKEKDSFFIQFPNTQFALQTSFLKGETRFDLIKIDRSPIHLPDVEKIKNALNIDMYQFLPAKLMEVYKELTVSKLCLVLGDKIFLYMELAIKNIKLFGIKFDEIKIPFRIIEAETSETQSMQLGLALILSANGVIFSSELPDELANWCLSLTYNPQQGEKDFIRELVKDLPQWLINRLPNLKSMEGELFPNTGCFKISAAFEEYTIYSNDLVKIKESKFSIQRNGQDKNPNNQAKEFIVEFSANLVIGDLVIPIRMNTNKGISASIDGEIKSKRLCEFMKKLPYKGKEKFRIKINQQLSKLNEKVTYSIDDKEIKFITNHLSIRMIKPEKNHAFVVVFEYFENKDLRNDKHAIKFKNIEDGDGKGFLKTIFKNTPLDIWIRHVSHKVESMGLVKGCTFILRLPIHKMPVLDSVIKHEFYIPVTLIKEQNKKMSIMPGQIQIAHLDLGIATLENSTLSMDMSEKSFTFCGDLDISIAKITGVKLVASIPNKSFGLSCKLSCYIELLGLIIHSLNVNMALSNGKLSGSVESEFSVEDCQNNGLLKIGLSPQGGGLRLIKARFPDGYTLSMKKALHILIPKKDHAQVSETINHALDIIFPYSFGPITEQDFINAIESSNHEEIKSIFREHPKALSITLDKEAVSFSLNAQIELMGQLKAFILAKFDLMNGGELVGSIKPFDIGGGLIRIKKSNHESNCRVIDTGGPVLYIRVPGLKALSDLENLKDIRFHMNGNIVFFGLEMDAVINYKDSRFYLRVNPSIHLPVISYNAALEIIADTDTFIFSMCTFISFHIPECQVLGITFPRMNFLSVTTELNIKYENLHFEIKGKAKVVIFDLPVELKFDCKLDRSDCETFEKFLAALAREIAKNAVNILISVGEQLLNQLASKLVNVIKEGLIYIGNEIVNVMNNLVEALVNFFDPDSYDKKALNIRNQKLALLRYLLRLNTEEKILQAFTLIHEIDQEPIPGCSGDCGINSFSMDILKKAVKYIENKPLKAFCYLRMIETQLILQPMTAQDYRCLSLTRYFLGMLYLNHDVPMSSKYLRHKTDHDKYIDHTYNTDTYLCNIEIKDIAVEYLMQSYRDSIVVGKKLTFSQEPSEFSLLPMYQLFRLNVFNHYSYTGWQSLIPSQTRYDYNADEMAALKKILTIKNLAGMAMKLAGSAIEEDKYCYEYQIVLDIFCNYLEYIPGYRDFSHNQKVMDFIKKYDKADVFKTLLGAYSCYFSSTKDKTLEYLINECEGVTESLERLHKNINLIYDNGIYYDYLCEPEDICFLLGYFYKNLASLYQRKKCEQERGEDGLSEKASGYLDKSVQLFKESMSDGVITFIKKRRIEHYPCLDTEATYNYDIRSTSKPIAQSFKKLGNMFIHGSLHGSHCGSNDKHNASDCDFCFRKFFKLRIKYLTMQLIPEFDEILLLPNHNSFNMFDQNLPESENSYSSSFDRNISLSMCLELIYKTKHNLTQSDCDLVFTSIDIAIKLHEIQDNLGNEIQLINSSKESALLEMLEIQKLIFRLEAISYLLFSSQRNSMLGLCYLISLIEKYSDYNQKMYKILKPDHLEKTSRNNLRFFDQISCSASTKFEKSDMEIENSLLFFLNNRHLKNVQYDALDKNMAMKHIKNLEIRLIDNNFRSPLLANKYLEFEGITLSSFTKDESDEKTPITLHNLYKITLEFLDYLRSLIPSLTPEEKQIYFNVLVKAGFFPDRSEVDIDSFDENSSLDLLSYSELENYRINMNNSRLSNEKSLYIDRLYQRNAGPNRAANSTSNSNHDVNDQNISSPLMSSRASPF